MTNKDTLKYNGIGQCAWCGARARTGRIDMDGIRYSACGRHLSTPFSVIPRIKTKGNR